MSENEHDDVVAICEEDFDLFADDVDDTNVLTVRAVKIRQVAQLSYRGLTYTEIAKTLNMSPGTVSKLRNSDECLQLISQWSASDLNYVQGGLRDKALPDMVKRIEEDIGNPKSPDKYKAANIIMKVYGLDGSKQVDRKSVTTYQTALRAIINPTVLELPEVTTPNSDAEVIDDAEFQEVEDVVIHPEPEAVQPVDNVVEETPDDDYDVFSDED